MKILKCEVDYKMERKAELKKTMDERGTHYECLDKKGHQRGYLGAILIDGHYVLRSEVEIDENGDLVRHYNSKVIGVEHKKEKAESRLEKIGKEQVKYLQAIDLHYIPSYGD